MFSHFVQFQLLQMGKGSENVLTNCPQPQKGWLIFYFFFLEEKPSSDLLELKGTGWRFKAQTVRGEGHDLFPPLGAEPGRAAGGGRGLPWPRSSGRWMLRSSARGFPAPDRSGQGSCRSVLNGCLLFGAAGLLHGLPVYFFQQLCRLSGAASPPLLHPAASPGEASSHRLSVRPHLSSSCPLPSRGAAASSLRASPGPAPLLALLLSGQGTPGCGLGPARPCEANRGFPGE